MHYDWCSVWRYVSAVAPSSVHWQTAYGQRALICGIAWRACCVFISRGLWLILSRSANYVVQQRVLPDSAFIPEGIAHHGLRDISYLNWRLPTYLSCNARVFASIMKHRLGSWVICCGVGEMMRSTPQAVLQTNATKEERRSRT